MRNKTIWLLLASHSLVQTMCARLMLIVCRERSVLIQSLHHFSYSIQNGGIYCVCKEGYIGMGTISSPCKPVWSESTQFQWFHWFSSTPVFNTLLALVSPLENLMETCVNVPAMLDTKEMEHGARVRSLPPFPHQYLSHCRYRCMPECDSQRLWSEGEVCEYPRWTLLCLSRGNHWNRKEGRL